MEVLLINTGETVTFPSRGEAYSTLPLDDSWLFVGYSQDETFFVDRYGDPPYPSAVSYKPFLLYLPGHRPAPDPLHEEGFIKIGTAERAFGDKVFSVYRYAKELDFDYIQKYPGATIVPDPDPQPQDPYQGFSCRVQIPRSSCHEFFRLIPEEVRQFVLFQGEVYTKEEEIYTFPYNFPGNPALSQSLLGWVYRINNL